MAALTGQCPICGTQLNLSSNLEVTEVITCSDCNNRVAVESIKNNQVMLQTAPVIEEDWGQ